MSHPLDALLKPQSIALVGASNRPGSPGQVLAELVIDSSYAGRVYPINPGYESILETPCYPNLNALSETVDHTILAVSNERLESALQEAIDHGTKAATIYSSCVLEDDTYPLLQERISTLAKKAGIPICGGNCMGFYSITQGLYAGVFPMPGEMLHGSISFIAQSGSAFAALAHNGIRLKFNLCVSSGNEMATTTDQYMDWALEQSETRVIGLFLESVRNPSGFIEALQKAKEKQIPVVVLKVGRSPLGAEMASTHTGAIAGNDAAYEAVFKKYGVIEVTGFDEMAAVLTLFQSHRRPGPGKLATIQESGGFMELVTDICHDMGIEYAQISAETKKELKKNLDPGLKPDNPLDAWGSNDNFEERFYACISAMMKDPAVAAGVFFTNFRDGYYLSEAFFRVIQRVHQEMDKPLIMGNCFSDITHQKLCRKTTDAGIPFIDGTNETLTAIKHLFAHRDRIELSTNAGSIMISETDTYDTAIVEKWKEKLKTLSASTLSESTSMELLRDFSITVPRHSQADDLADAISAAESIGYPVVLKTAEPGIDHKSDQGGVVVNIQDSDELTTNFEDFKSRLGARVLISEMVESGTEVGLGVIVDPQFGPLILISAGGVLIELISDRAVSLAPITCEEADIMLQSLKIDKVIQGLRGKSAGNRKALVEIIVNVSILAYELRDYILEIDINPVIVNPDKATAVDALVLIR